MADIVYLSERREPQFNDDPTNVSVVKFFDGTPFAEPQPPAPEKPAHDDASMVEFFLPPQFRP